MKKNKLVFCLILLCLILTACVFKKPQIPKNNIYSTPLLVGNKKIFVEIAKDKTQITKGLSKRENISFDQGMLFDFTNTKTTYPGFWMKDMKFNIDIIWIKGNKIIGCTQDIPIPKKNETPLPLYYPPGEIDMALEVTSEFCKLYKITNGTEVKL